MTREALSLQVVASGQITDAITGSAPRGMPSVTVVHDADGRVVKYLNTKVTPDARFSVFGDPMTMLVPAANVLRVEMTTPGYADAQFTLNFTAAELARIDRVLTVDGEVTTVRIIDSLPRVQDVALTPDPVTLKGRVARAEDPDVPIVSADVEITAPTPLGPVSNRCQRLFHAHPRACRRDHHARGLGGRTYAPQPRFSIGFRCTDQPGQPRARTHLGRPTMPEYLAPGVFVEEVPSGVKPIAGVSTSTIGMVGMTERGPVNRPALVTSFGDFTRTFGGLLNSAVYTNHRDALPHAVQGAFDNGAGRVYVNRIVGDGADFATVDLLGDDAETPAGTALSARAGMGAVLLQIDDGTNISNGDTLVLLDGPRTEYVEADSDPVAIGLALTGRLHAEQPDTVAVDLQDPPAEGADLTAGITGEMEAGGGLELDPATVGALVAGQVLRVRQTDDDSLTEYVTITNAGDAAFNEGTLLFDHPQATAEVRVVTMADAGTSTTVDGLTALGSSVVAVGDTTGIAEDNVVAIGAGPTREFHVVRTIVSQLSIGTTPTTAIHSAGVELRKQVGLLRVHARDEGGWANRLRVRAAAAPLNETTVMAGAGVGDSPVTFGTGVGLYPGSVVTITRGGTLIARQRVTGVSGVEVELDGGAAAPLFVDDVVTSQEFALTVELLDENNRVTVDEAFDNLAQDPDHPRYAPTIVGSFDRAMGESSASGLSDLIRLSDLTRDDAGADEADAAARRLAVPIAGINRALDDGDDDLATVTENTYRGTNAADVEDRTGVHALTGVDDISIVAVPGRSEQVVQNEMITHCELMRYRIAVMDSQPNANLAAVQAQRALYDSTRAALYYPWLQISDPFGQPGDRLIVPPSGHVCGAFARTDTERGVHKAPANVVVRNILDLNANVTTGQQEILNPRGINAIRDFSNLGRAKRIWGARTVSSDAEWKYVPVRRLFLFVEKSIERGTQFAVFEPNGPALWATINRSLTNFLTGIWASGALFGASPEEAFFVDVGPNTMTQSDIDNGRLIVNVGIAPLKPAEFVIFRISQKTASAS